MIKSEKSTAVTAKTGFLIDMKMYKAPDYRCLKPKQNQPPEKWPHYYMPEFRAAKNKAELKTVEEVPFDINFLNMEDPKVFKAMVDPRDGPNLWKKTYGMDFVDFLPTFASLIHMQKVYENCLGET